MTTKEKLEEITVVIKAIGLTPKLQYTENQTAQMYNTPRNLNKFF